MIIKEVSVWKSQKIQIEQYEPRDFAYGMKAELSYEDEPEAVKLLLETYVDKWLAWEVKKWKNPSRAVSDIKKGEVPFN